MTEPRDIPQCSAPECTRRGPFGFHWGGKSRYACRQHRARGQAWLERMKSAHAPYTAAEAQAEQGRLL